MAEGANTMTRFPTSALSKRKMPGHVFSSCIRQICPFQHPRMAVIWACVSCLASASSQKLGIPLFTSLPFKKQVLIHLEPLRVAETTIAIKSR